MPGRLGWADWTCGGWSVEAGGSSLVVRFFFLATYQIPFYIICYTHFSLQSSLLSIGVTAVLRLTTQAFTPVSPWDTPSLASILSNGPLPTWSTLPQTVARASMSPWDFTTLTGTLTPVPGMPVLIRIAVSTGMNIITLVSRPTWPVAPVVEELTRRPGRLVQRQSRQRIPRLNRPRVWLLLMLALVGGRLSLLQDALRLVQTAGAALDSAGKMEHGLTNASRCVRRVLAA